jgi:hypothetical protein
MGSVAVSAKTIDCSALTAYGLGAKSGEAVEGEQQGAAAYVGRSDRAL